MNTDLLALFDGTFDLDLTGLRDLAPDVIDEHGLPRIMPASFYAAATPAERAWLGLRFGLYGLPTLELVDWLRVHLRGRSAIEIGAGNGRMAAALDIPATDLYLQEDHETKRVYDAIEQPTITYGPNVEKIEGQAAVRKYRPQVVIGVWVTHRYSQRRAGRGGNQYGPNTDWILDHCEEYVLIGNQRTHAKHPLWDEPYDIIFPPWLYSRTHTDSPNFIAWWRRG
jgi:hypothetical protein